jgi:hypothetical protein
MIARLVESTAIVVVAVLLAHSPAATAADRSSAELERIWRERSSATDPIKVEWVELRSQPRSNERAAAAQTARPHNNLANATIPSIQASFLLDGMRARYKTVILNQQQGGEFGLADADWGFDGSVSRSLITDKANPKPGGTIDLSSQFDQFTVASLKPILIAYRTLAPHVLFRDSYTLSVVAGKEVLDGKHCQVAQLIADGKPIVATLWLDGTEDALPLRCTLRMRGQLMSEYRMSYDKEGLLTGWEVTCLNDENEIIESGRAQDVTVVFKPKVSPTDFVVNFPRGTVVLDKRTQKAVTVVSRGGDSFTPLSQATTPWFSVVAWVMGSAIAISAALVVWRRYLHRGS